MGVGCGQRVSGWRIGIDSRPLLGQPGTCTLYCGAHHAFQALQACEIRCLAHLLCNSAIAAGVAGSAAMVHDRGRSAIGPTHSSCFG